MLLCCSLISIAQHKTHSNDFVECYYDNTSSLPILIYDNINGKIVDSLYNQNNKSTWYKLAIAESNYGWFKIKNLQRLPDNYKDFDYENYWVKNDNFFVAIANYDPNSQVYIYDLPSTSSNRIHKLDNNQDVTITEISELWAKVKFRVGKKEIEGWLNHTYQCALPSTICPK